MADIPQRIRNTAPRPESLPELDVDALLHRARRRRAAARVGGVAGAVTAVVAVAALLVGVPQLADRLGLPTRGGSDVQLAPGGGDSAAPLPSEADPSQDATSDPGVPPVGVPSPTPEPGGEQPDPSDTPAGPEGEILSSPTPGQPAPAPHDRPSAPVCGTQNLPDGVATVVFGPDVPVPRCLQVLPGQRIRLVNGSALPGQPDLPGEVIEAGLGGYLVRLEPGEQVTLPLPVSAYLQAGVHRVDSAYGPAQASVWVLETPAVSAGQQQAIDALVAFAQNPSDATFAALPLAEAVRLGSDTQLGAPQPAAALRDPSAWQGPNGASALKLLAGAEGPLVHTVGERPHCGSPMREAPAEVAELTRLAVQVPPTDGCDGWFAVDLYVDDGGTGLIHAVTTATAP